MSTGKESRFSLGYVVATAGIDAVCRGDSEFHISEEELLMLIDAVEILDPDGETARVRRRRILETLRLLLEELKGSRRGRAR